VLVLDRQLEGAVHHSGASPTDPWDRINGHLIIIVALNVSADFSLAPTYCTWMRIESGQGSFQSCDFP
jgi:hypothetical protein